MTTSSSITVRAEVDTYPQRLLRVARSFIDQGEVDFGIAVVVAHMACEIATERSLSDAFAAKGMQDFYDWVRSLNCGYNLANPRVRGLYTTLTGDEVQQRSFWQQFKESATRRNNIIHRGATTGKTEAEESHKAASDLVAHLKK
jgi:hypothetical protein